MARILAIACCLPLAMAYPAAREPDAVARKLRESAPFRQAAAFIRTDYPRFVRELIALTEIPAPPFKEERRARAYLAMLRDAGLRDVEMDAEGNVMGLRQGSGGGRLLAVAAHLDTVFPEGTDVKVKRAGTRLSAPGIGDNTRGLASMLAVIRAMDAARLRTVDDILFVANVGEEGEGDLRGVKYLLRSGKHKDRITQFLAIEGGEQGSITRGGVGSKRYRVVFKGPGGHSYTAFGLVNPAYAMSSAISALAALRVPADPKTTYSVGVVRGGTSVNSIPFEVSMDVDLRSEACAELKKLDDAFVAVVRSAVAGENRARSTRAGRVEAELKIIGERPCGETAMNAPILRTVTGVLQAFGLQPVYDFGSTDSNVPMSLGIPALTVSGPSSRGHSLDEWTDVEPRDVTQSIEVSLAIVLSVAGPGD